MIPRTPSAGPVSRIRDLLSPRIWLGVMLLAFSALVVPTVGQGISSWDGHKILLSVQTLVERHHVVTSRFPGHPTTDFYLFGSIGWVLKQCGGRHFDATVFLTLQWIAAMATALVFHHWLKRSGFSPVRVALATACLLFAPQFIDQTLNGEEFIHGMLCLLGAMALLFAADDMRPVRPARLAAAAGLWAMATGCRPELALAGAIIFPAYFLRHGIRDWKIWLGAAAAAVCSLGLVWLPILLSPGLHALTDAEMNESTKLLGWGYKVLFWCFGFPTSVVLGAVAFGSLAALRRRKEKPAPTDCTEWISLAMIALYLGLFLLRPQKPAYALICVPFLLWIAARRSLPLLIATTVLTLAGLFVGVDIFRDRVLCPPRFTEGIYQSALTEKPAQKIHYVTALSKTELSSKSVIVGDVWEWAYLDLVKRRTFSGKLIRLGDHIGTGFMINDDPNRILLPREVLRDRDPQALQKLHADHYEIVIDRQLWRAVFAKYDITTETIGDAAYIGSIPVRLITVEVNPK